jgi:hypothetical protein
MSKAADLANLIGNINAGGGGVNRNVIINGAMNVAQRGTSSTGIGASSGYFVCDRWRFSKGGDASAGRFTMTQDSSAPEGFANSMKLACTTTDTSIAADEFLFIGQRIEGQNMQTFAKGTSSAKPFAVSFYVKGNASATYVCELADQDNGRQISKTFNVTTDWTRVELNFPADTTGALDDDNAKSFELFFILHAGSNYTSGTINSSSWASSTDANRVGSGTTSFFDSTDRTFFITGVQLEVGQNPTTFEHEPFERTLEKCQRYYAEKEIHQTYMDSNADSAQYLGYDLPVEQRADGTGSVITQVVYWSGGAPTNVTPNVYPKTDHIRITTSSLSSARGMVSGRIASDAEL